MDQKMRIIQIRITVESVEGTEKGVIVGGEDRGETGKTSQSLET
jgi:hypothetical protein